MELNRIHSSKLVKGNNYSDLGRNSKNATILKFMGREKGALLFQHISGPKDYFEEEGVIRFSSPNHFYEI